MDHNKSHESLGDVDELRYETLYTKSIVLRRKLDALESLAVGQKGKVTQILNKLAVELSELCGQINAMSSKKLTKN